MTAAARGLRTLAACAALALSLPAGALADGSAPRWIQRAHTWVSIRSGRNTNGGFAGPSLTSEPVAAPASTPASLALGYAAGALTEIAVGRAFARGGWEVQALYASAPLDCGGDSVGGEPRTAGSASLARGTASMLMAGAGWGVRGRFLSDREAGDAGIRAGLLVGLVWSDGLAPTAAASALGIERIRAPAAFLWCLDARYDQRIAGSLVGSVGLREGAAPHFTRIEPAPGSPYRAADVAWMPVQVSLGLAWWF